MALIPKLLFFRDVQADGPALVVVPSNAEARRSFSVQNRIKTKLRSHLSIGRLDQLIRLSYNKQEIIEFPFEAALEVFMEDPHRWY